MELRHLRYFVAVAETLSFTAAAARLRVSQPPLSQQIRDLERELGVALFERTSRRVGLTAAGAAFLDHARAILDQAELAAEQVRAIGRGHMGSLEIGLTGSVLGGRLGALLAAYSACYPKVALRLHEMSPQEQETALINRRTDLSFLRWPNDDPDLAIERAWPETVGLALPRRHRLGARRCVDLADLRDESFVFLRRTDSRFARHLWTCCIDAGFAPRIIQEVGDAQALVNLVAAGFGVALLPESIGRLSRAEIAYRPLAGTAASADVSIAYRADHRAVAGEFLEFARKFLAERHRVA
ncbi:LysR family transcriptional regulator [Acidiphilium sp. AL]|uniref:LysR family transcriptional regulator n=1 Tax=Acidiphilium iwatense TaxID=768198 RepID=A0ABS9E095_9PROT|nr:MULTISPECIES: LysR family transcriptional regulator [Acidiphilium]MCF3948439.1 LysR family transcriptional regulator [Acidiphilium iwatense]MCU4160209.1 LysR family transcriptional regulator [Acidiphilium sp. AL]